MVAHHPHPTTTDGGSAGFASLHGCNLLGQCRSYAEEQKPALRVMVVANCARFTSLAVNVTAVYVAKLLKGHAKHS
jgi:hypothetical protein